METIRVNVTLDQLKQALRQLPPQEKMALWRLCLTSFVRLLKLFRESHAIKNALQA